jgi:hypothetical protein
MLNITVRVQMNLLNLRISKTIDLFLHLEAIFSQERYLEAEQELRTDANTHYRTKIGWATGYEIIATLLLLLATGLAFLLGAASRANDI